jgi:glycosyltransferase involved in cell wall biosynthesis
MTEALESEHPMLADPPLHPSYEDRPGAPDRVMAGLDADAFEHHVGVWTHALRAAGARGADVLHLHHLTPINEAARRAAPGVPIVGHLHGTELLMLESIERDPGRWAHGREWAARMREWARACSKLVVLSGTQVARVGALLGIAPEDCVRVPNGFDPGEFAVREVDRLGHWRRHLVRDPRGWRPGGEAGSITYDEAAVEAFAGEATVLLYVGRFTEVKRLDVLLEAYALALPRLRRRAPLVLCGGFPGEWEGEHPWEAVQRLGVPDVFLAGWHEHDELPSFMAASDAIVLPSVREQFGQVLVEGMACGLPAIAVDAYGPTEIVEPGRTGWLVPPGDAARLADALVEAVNDPAERRRRGRLARADAEVRFAWPSLAGRVASIYDEVAASRRP